MSGHFHAVVWIDHREARVFHFSSSEADEVVVHPQHPTKSLHHKANTIGSGHAPEDHVFLQNVTNALADAGAILITGPASEKTVLVDHIGHHAPALKTKIKGVEALDHPTDGEILALARKFFKDDHQEPPRIR